MAGHGTGAYPERLRRGWSDVPDFAAREGGVVVIAAITRYVEGRARWDEAGLRLEYDLKVPPDAHTRHLGGHQRGVVAADVRAH